MSGPGAGKSSVPSPYVSLREAVRPAIFAYGILASERGRAGVLVEACDEVLQLTHELLKKSALAHLLTPEFGQQTPADIDGTGDGQARLLEAYADVGMLWAKVVGSCMAIASVLLERAEWAKVNHLAEILAAVGETASASELSRQALSGPDRHVRGLINNVHDAMREEEITKALEVLEKVPANSPVRNELGLTLTSICRSILVLFPLRTKALHYTASLARNGCANGHVYSYLPYVSGEFSAVRHRESGE